MSTRSTPPPQLATSEPWIVVGISRSAWTALRSRGETPAPIHILTGKPTWRISDLEKWLGGYRAVEKPSARGGRRETAVG